MAEPIDGKAHIRMISEALQGILGTPAPLHEAPVDDFDPNPFINRASRGGAKKGKEAKVSDSGSEWFGKGEGVLRISWNQITGQGIKTVYADSSGEAAAELSKDDVRALVKLLNELQRKMT